MKLSIFFLHGKWENASADKWKFSLKTPDLHRNCTPPFWKFSGVSPNLTGPAQKLLLHSPVVPGMHGVISMPFSFSVTVIELSMLYSLLPVPTCLSQCRWRHLGDQTELHLAMLGEISSVTTSCVCQTGGVTVGCARQIFINSQDLLEDVGSLSEYSLSSDLRSFSFWGCEEQHFLTLCSSVQFLFVLVFFYFISLPYEGKPGFPWSGFSHGFLCALMRFKIWSSLPNLWASAQASLCCTRGAILRICPISPV